MSTSNEVSPSRSGLSSWWKQLKRNQNETSNESFTPAGHHHYYQQQIGSEGNLTRPALKLKSRSSNSVKPIPLNEQLIRQQRDGFLASQNKKLDFGNEVFGVALEQSLKIAASLISVPSDSPDDFIHYGRIPLVVGKCGSFLKAKGLKVEGIFRVAGASRRVKELQYIFSTPPEYGRKLNWEGYTVHDAASLIRRFLNSLPEPLVPLALYEDFREPVRSRPRILKHLKARNDSIEKRIKVIQQQQSIQGQEKNTAATGNDFNEKELTLTPEELELKKQKAAKKQKKIAKDLRNALKEYRLLIDRLPQAQKQLLFYLLDILSMFADNSKENLMTARNLATVFQPSILSHPNHDLTPEEYALSQAIVELLIEYSKRLLPDVGKFRTSSSTNLLSAAANNNKTSSTSNNEGMTSKEILAVRGIGSRPHSRSLSSAGGVPDAIHPKNYNEDNSNVLTKNRTPSETNILASKENNNTTTDQEDTSDDDEIFHPASSDFPVQPSTSVKTATTASISNNLTETNTKSNQLHSEQLLRNAPQLQQSSRSSKHIDIPVSKTLSEDVPERKKPSSPTSGGFHIPRITKPRPFSMFVGNLSNDDISSERESRWSNHVNLGVSPPKSDKKESWFKRLRSTSRSKNDRDREW